MLSYVEGDYAGAVAKDGQIIDQDEVDEQLSMAADAAALLVAAQLGPADPSRQKLAELNRAFHAITYGIKGAALANRWLGFLGTRMRSQAGG